ncbi:MAG: lactate racemase domain-containing protein [Promethearchaeota archaeon]
MSETNNLNDSRTPSSLPLIRCIRQEIKTPRLSDLEGDLKSKLDDFGLDKIVNPNDTIAITASSRGINKQSLILKTLVEYLIELKASPFIIPAMGSHGGATTEGQLQILKDYGISEEKMGCPIKASMDVVEIGESEFGYPIYIDKFAASADKIIVVNKIKTHSKFLGDVESGLSKMCLIGLGKHKGAKLYHRLIERYSWPRVIKSLLKDILKTIPIICGIGIIQNINNEPAKLHILHPEDFLTKEPDLLREYKELTEHLPFKEIDLLIVDEMGKNIFGTGMDTNITGRKEGSFMLVQWIFVRDLTKESHGNAQGIGLADFTTKKLVDKIDYSKMYANALTAYRTDSPKIPIFQKNDEEVLKTIVNLAELKDPSNFKLIWIKNTLELQKIIVSEYFFDQVDSQDKLDFIGDPEIIKFDQEGFLINSKSYW